MPKLRSATTLAFALLMGMPLLRASDVIAVDLEPKTLEAFNHYVQVTEARIEKEVARPGSLSLP